MRDRFQLGQTDAVTWLQGLPDESIDLVVIDPPCESLEKHRAIGTTTRLEGESRRVDVPIISYRE